MPKETPSDIAEIGIPNLLIIDRFLEKHSTVFQALLETVQWDDSMTSRKTASFGVPYNYSQMNYAVVPMHPVLVPISEKLSERFGITFNNCLLNYYETGDNTMGFHSDDTSSLQPGTGVAIISLGNRRNITYRNKKNPNLRHMFTLEAGSLLYMDSAVQNEWLHAIRKQFSAGSRISLTWRAFCLVN
jgi:alkylated DNA repair dioxygenase AlkB